ncbi:MAG: TetR/AcrR family transcriptional regulator [Thermoleophilia bacterium]|nr:TetR/AcrR family transcriptional regulator [Thermoleophilia bacterium]
MARDGAKTRERILDEAQQLILEQGLAATSIDEVLAAAGTSKGAFFHHFPSKNHLARAIVERYAEGDVAFLEEFMTRAEEESDDPAEQLIAFFRFFEEAADELVTQQPSCLYVSYIYDRQLFDDGTNDVIVETLLEYRRRLAEKIEAAVTLHPPAFPVEPAALADHATVTFEGAFVLARALGDATVMRRQLELVRRTTAVLFGLPTD